MKKSRFADWNRTTFTEGSASMSVISDSNSTIVVGRNMLIGGLLKVMVHRPGQVRSVLNCEASDMAHLLRRLINRAGFSSPRDTVSGSRCVPRGSRGVRRERLAQIFEFGELNLRHDGLVSRRQRPSASRARHQGPNACHWGMAGMLESFGGGSGASLTTTNEIMAIAASAPIK